MVKPKTSKNRTAAVTHLQFTSVSFNQKTCTEENTVRTTEYPKCCVIELNPDTHLNYRTQYSIDYGVVQYDSFTSYGNINCNVVKLQVNSDEADL